MKKPAMMAVGLAMAMAAGLAGQAEAWTPGEAKPGCPHVVAGRTEGDWVPEFGWKYASDAPDDFSVEEIIEPAVVLAIDGKGTVEIPAPKGFWRPPEGGWLAERFAEADSQVPSRRVLGHWAASDPLLPGFPEATAQVIREVDGKLMRLARFSEYRNTLAQGTDGKQGILSLSKYRDETDRFCYTVVRAEAEAEGGWFVNSCAILWLRGRVLTLGVGCSVADESALDVAVPFTRNHLDRWLDAISAANPGTPEEADAQLGGDSGETGKEEKHWNGFAIAAVVLLLAGVGLAALMLFRKRKRQSSGNREPQNRAGRK